MFVVYVLVIVTGVVLYTIVGLGTCNREALRPGQQPLAVFPCALPARPPRPVGRRLQRLQPGAAGAQPADDRLPPFPGQFGLRGKCARELAVASVLALRARDRLVRPEGLERVEEAGGS